MAIHRARFYAADTVSVYDWDPINGLPSLQAVGGTDHYRIVLWPRVEDDPGSKVLKWLYCPPGVEPTFHPALAAFVASLGDRAGNPLDCGLTSPGEGIVQETTTAYPSLPTHGIPPQYFPKIPLNELVPRISSVVPDNDCALNGQVTSTGSGTASDDIEIFGESFTSLVFVDHEGQLSVVWLR